MVSVCLPSDALLQHLPSYLSFSYLGCGVSFHSCSSKVQPLFLTLDEGYLLTATLPDLQRGIAPLGAPVPAQPWLLGCGVGPPGHRPWPWAWAAPPGRRPWPRTWCNSSRRSPHRPRPQTRGSSSQPFLRRRSLALSATAPALRCGVTPLGRRPLGMGSSWLLPLTSNVGWLLSAVLSVLVAATCIVVIAG